MISNDAAAARSCPPQLNAADCLPVLADTKHRDYILSDYTPRCSAGARPHERALRPESLLRHALRRAGLLDQVWPICELLREQLGPEETVWGIKYGAAGFALELYFYRDCGERASPLVGERGRPAVDRKTIAALREILAPHLRFSPGGSDKPYFMCSFEINQASLARGDGGCFRIYVGSGDERRTQCGFSYRIEEQQAQLENHYWFYHAQKSAELGDAVRRVRAGQRSGPQSCWATLLPKELRDCFTICYAVKSTRDGLYYSRVSSSQLALGLKRWPHHPDAVHFAQLLDNQHVEFEHLSWDLGFDFSVPPGAVDLTIDKFAIHGVF